MTHTGETLRLVREFICTKIATRIEEQYFVGIPAPDGFAVCALLLASGITQTTEPGTRREEVIDAWLKDLRTQIEHLQAIQDRRRAADIEGCT